MKKIDRREFIKAGAAGTLAVAVGSNILTSCAHEAAGIKPSVLGAGMGGYFEKNFGMDSGVLRSAIRQGMSKGGDFCEIFLQHRVRDYIGYEDGQVNRAYADIDLGAGVRVLKGEQTGYAYTEELTPKSLKRAAETAAAIASGTPGNFTGSFKGEKIPDMYERKRVWIHVAPDRKIAIARKVGDKMPSLDKAIIKSSVWFGDEDEVMAVANSDGLFVEDTRPMTFIYATCVAERNGRRETNWHSRSQRKGPGYYHPDSFLEKIAKQAVRKTMLLFDAVEPPAGEMPVVLAPGTSGILLHEAMGHGFEADFNRKKTSIYSTMMGKKIAPPFVTIVDTALVPGARGSINVDDEGTPGQRTVLVENGKLVSYMHDRISAGYFKVKRTGNGRRESFRYIPIPRMRITTMESGPDDPEEIVKSVKKGIYAENFSNGQVTIGAGDYSFYVKVGYMIENGKITAPIKDVNLVGNGPDTLSKVVMVGNDEKIEEGGGTCGKEGQGVPVGFGLPTVKVSSITVGGVKS
ncbi:MAG: twin-arginine translocation signal domain-containing protein [Deltaproteobacteria bacterium]|nr:twin-arginine translocation signal domain-containing protein [Deltaproteobacteria bacterium]